MKKVLVSFLPILFPLIVAGYCPSGDLLGNTTICCVSGLSSNPDDITALVWIQGKADWTTDGNNTGVSPGNCTSGSPMGGCDSDGIGAVATDCDWLGDHVLITNDCAGVGSAGDYFLWTDWYTSQYDGCPSADSSERAILLIYDTSGKYVLQSRSKGKDWCNWDEIETTVSAYYLASAGTGSQMGWNKAYFTFNDLPDSIKYGTYASGDQPSSSLVTGFRLYFWPHSYMPNSYATEDWIPGDIYPIDTMLASNVAVPVYGSDDYCVVYFSRALIIGGKELPFVSRATDFIYPMNTPPGPWPVDRSSCECTGWSIEWIDYPQATGYDLSIWGGGESYFIENATSPYIFQEADCDALYHFDLRAKGDGWTTCWWSTYDDTVASYDNYEIPPLSPEITSIVDNDPNSATGLTITYNQGIPAMRHDLYRDGVLVQSGFASGSVAGGLDCNGSHSFRISAVSDYECWTVYSDPVSATDECVGAPGELAQGGTSGDALIFSNDKTTISWPSHTGATGYRLYRGMQADLQNLPGGAVDNSCLKYDGTSISQNLSSDDPSGVTGRFYWYLVTAYNGSGEGPAGTGRIINSSGECP